MTGSGGLSKAKAWLIVLIALIDDIAALALVFVVLWFLDVKLSLATVVVIGLVLGTLIFFIHRAVVPSLRRRRVTGAEAMVGTFGEVTEALTPKGCVKVHGEIWQAKSVGGDIEVGVEVEILAIKGLNLEVKRKES